MSSSQPQWQCGIYGDPSWREAGAEIVVSYGINFCSNIFLKLKTRIGSSIHPPVVQSAAGNKSDCTFVLLSQG